MRNRVVTAVNSLMQRLRGAPQGRVVNYDPTIDSLRRQLTKNLTFRKLDTILRNGDDGDISETLELFEEIEQRDDRIRSVAGTRRRALTGLPYEIVSAAEVQKQRVDAVLADETAAYVREHLDGMKGLRRALKHLADALGTNLAVLEQIWEYGELTDWEPIRNSRLTIKTQESMGVRVITKTERTYGVAATSPKFVVHIPEPATGSPVSKAIMGPLAFLYLFKRLSISDWGVFCAIYGMPVRVGRYETGASPEEKTVLKNMLQNLGSNAWAMISRNVELIFQESSARGVQPFEAFVNMLNRQCSILVLGANLSSDTTGGTGTFAAAEVQDRVRDDLLDNDIENEAETVREQIFGPMIDFKFPGKNAPVPYFKRSKVADSKAMAETVKAWQDTGLEVPEEWARVKSGIPELKDGDKALVPSLDAFGAGLSEDV